MAFVASALMYFVIGTVASTLNGGIGLGGGLVLSACLTIVPPLFGFRPISMFVIGAYVATLSIVSAGVGFISYLRTHMVNLTYVLYAGIPAIVGSGFGSEWAHTLPNRILLGILTMALLGSLVLFWRPMTSTDGQPTARRRSLVGLLCLVIGVLGGLLGIGGGFLTMPVLVGVGGLKVRTAIGTGLGVNMGIALTSESIRLAHVSSLSLVVVASIIATGGLGAQIGVRRNRGVSERTARCRDCCHYGT